MSEDKPDNPELRFNEDGTLDEIVATADGAAFFHLEQMDTNHWWFCVEVGGRAVNVWLHARGKITAHHEVYRVGALQPREAPDD